MSRCGNLDNDVGILPVILLDRRSIIIRFTVISEFSNSVSGILPVKLLPDASRNLQQLR
jgi:hypothetical protein